MVELKGVFMTKYRALKVEGKKKDLHRHLMEIKLGRKLTRGEVVHHINGDPLDNRIENLQLMTYREHNILHGCVGRAKPIRKLSDEQLKEIRTCDESSRELARRYGVSHTAVARVRSGETYLTTS